MGNQMSKPLDILVSGLFTSFVLFNPNSIDAAQRKLLTMQLFVKPTDGDATPVDLPLDATVRDLKNQISLQSNQALEIGGRTFGVAAEDDDISLHDLGVAAEALITVVPNTFFFVENTSTVYGKKVKVNLENLPMNGHFMFENFMKAIRDIVVEQCPECGKEANSMYIKIDVDKNKISKVTWTQREDKYDDALGRMYVTNTEDGVISIPHFPYQFSTESTPWISFSVSENGSGVEMPLHCAIPTGLWGCHANAIVRELQI